MSTVVVSAGNTMLGASTSVRQNATNQALHSAHATAGSLRGSARVAWAGGRFLPPPAKQQLRNVLRVNASAAGPEGSDNSKFEEMRKQRKDVGFEELASDYALFGELLGEDAKITKNKIQQKRKELRLEKGVVDEKSNLEPMSMSTDLPSYADFDRLLKDGVRRGSQYAKPEGETKSLTGAKAPNRVSGSLPPAETDWRKEEMARVRSQGTQVLLQKATSANAGSTASKPSPARPSLGASPPRASSTPASPEGSSSAPSSSSTLPTYDAFDSLLQQEARVPTGPAKGPSRPEMPAAPAKAKPTLAPAPRGSDFDTRWRGEEAERVKQRMEAMGLGPGGVAALAGAPKPQIGSEAKAPAPMRPAPAAPVEPAKAVAASAVSSPAPTAAGQPEKKGGKGGKAQPSAPQGKAQPAAAEPPAPSASVAPTPLPSSPAPSAAPPSMPKQKPSPPVPRQPEAKQPEAEQPEAERPVAAATVAAATPSSSSTPAAVVSAPEAKGPSPTQGDSREAPATTSSVGDVAGASTERAGGAAERAPAVAASSSEGGPAKEEVAQETPMSGLNRPKRTAPLPEEAAPAVPAAAAGPARSQRGLGGWSTGPRGVEHAVAGIAHTEDNAELDAEWHKMELLKVTNETVLASVIGSNNGGLLVRIGNLTGFVPASQLHPRRTAVLKKAAQEAKAAGAMTQGADKEKDEQAAAARTANMSRERAELLGSLVGQTLVLRVLVVERSAGRFVLSERAVGDVSTLLKEQVMSQLNVGDIVKARVTSFTAFGAFVEVRGVDALIHVTEIAWVRPMHPRDVVSIGEEIDAKVIRLDMEQRRIFLSRRQTLPDPLLQTLDSLVAAGDGGASAGEALRRTDSSVEGGQLIAGLSEVIQKLREEEGVQSVSIGRCMVGNAFAPALQLFLSSQDEPGSYKVLGRRGRDVQEVSIKSTLSREDLRTLLQSVSDATIATSSISE